MVLRTEVGPGQVHEGGDDDEGVERGQEKVEVPDKGRGAEWTLHHIPHEEVSGPQEGGEDYGRGVDEE